ncbi:AIM24 family protein [Haloferula sp. A504]|uniref:AIM24 family protein n=1 Tax=Haloferula sp. A504 TaxID=3373601 RepID=UPI0031C1C13A|nr:AIM24 family protein [Verrucomicrobiaceae bacterium E54]
MSTPPPMPQSPSYSLDEFLSKTAQQDRGQGLFELETPRLLEVNLNGRVNTKMGSMVSYRGQIKFTREKMMDQGLGNLLKKAVSGEGMSITYADGQGKLYLADAGKKVSIIRLQNEEIFINGNDVLAFEPSLSHRIEMMRKVAALASGGLFNIHLTGSGMVALTTHYEPITLKVEPGNPVITDPNATVAWSGGLKPQFRTDVSFRTFLGRGSGESFQMQFEGSGFVVIQPYEEVAFAAQAG